MCIVRCALVVIVLSVVCYVLFAVIGCSSLMTVCCRLQGSLCRSVLLVVCLLGVVDRMLFVMRCVLFGVCGLLFVLCGLLLVVCCVAYVFVVCSLFVACCVV